MDFSISLSRLFWEVRANLWTELAQDTGSSYSRRTHLVAGLVRQFLPSGTVLDVGCGVGLLVGELQASGYDAYGCDIALSMVRRARERAGALDPAGGERFHLCSATHLPFKRTFDAITAIGVFPYVRDCGEFLDLLSQHLEPGGLLIASCINRRGLYPWVLMLQHLAKFRPNPEWVSVWRNLRRTGLWSGGYLDGPPGRQCTDAASFDRLLLGHGFTLLEGIDLYNLLGALDANPQRRGALSRRLARRGGWTHLVLARKRGNYLGNGLCGS